MFWLGTDYSEADLEKAVESSISTVDAVLRGEVYCVILEKLAECDNPSHADSWEVVESLGGIIGYDQAEAEADAMIRYKRGIVDYQGEPA